MTKKDIDHSPTPKGGDEFDTEPKDNFRGGENSEPRKENGKPSDGFGEDRSGGPIENPGPKPFSPDSLRITGDINDVGAEKLLLRIPVRKPNKQEFYRVSVDPDYRLICAIFELKDEQEVYLVTPAALHALAEDLRHVELVLCINRQGAIFFWPVPVPAPDGRTNSWHQSAREAAALAKDGWIRMVANMSEGSYSVYRATGAIPDPVWPEMSMTEMLQLAFKDGRLIDKEDHPVVARLNGA